MVVPAGVLPEMFPRSGVVQIELVVHAAVCSLHLPVPGSRAFRNVSLSDVSLEQVLVEHTSKLTAIVRLDAINDEWERSLGSVKGTDSGTSIFKRSGRSIEYCRLETVSMKRNW